MFENSNLIQVYPSENMIWKGHEWSSIKCLVKVDENFRTSFAGQKPKYALRMLLENVLTNTFFSPWKHTRYFRLSFHNNIPEDMETETKSETKMIYIKENPYIDVTIEVHKALFKGGDKFRIVAAATNATQTKHKYVEDVVFGASKDIVVSNLLLKVEEAFSLHQRITKVSDDMFVYYNKMGELGDGLRLLIHLLDENGKPYKVHNDLFLHTELVYEDCLPVLIVPFAKQSKHCHSSTRKNHQPKEKEIFVRMDGEPVIRHGENCTSFNFHLEDVIYHHHGHDGYRVKVSVPQKNNTHVYPGIMSQIIAVLSKPKKICMNYPENVSKEEPLIRSEEKRIVKDHYTPIVKYSTPNAVVQNGDWDGKLLSVQSTIRNTSNKRKADDISNEKNVDDQFKDNAFREDKVSVPMHAIYDSFICNGSCFSCQANVTAKSILIPTSHFIGCKLAVNVLPILKHAHIPFTFAISHDSSAPSTPLPNIVTSKSFEECGHALESIDESIFEDNENQPPSKFVGSSKTTLRKEFTSRQIESSKVHLGKHQVSSALMPDDKFILENVLSKSFDSESNEDLLDDYNEEEEALLLVDFANAMNVKIDDAIQNYE